MKQVIIRKKSQDELSNDNNDFRAAVIAGFRRNPKRIPCKFLYDERGDELFDRICRLDEYYLTRAETSILNQYVGDISKMIGSDAMVVELGCGKCRKTPIILNALQNPAAYIPIDISRETLLDSTKRIRTLFPDLRIKPIACDFTKPIHIPVSFTEKRAHRIIAFFPGSTIGNFEPREALDFLKTVASLCRHQGGLLIGFDLEKSAQIIEPAYNDRTGVTAQFNLNLAKRIGEEFETDLGPDDFSHHAFYDAAKSRVEMHLISNERKAINLDGNEFTLEKGERIITEYSYKYSVGRFSALARLAGFDIGGVWKDNQGLFAVMYLGCKPKGRLGYRSVDQHASFDSHKLDLKNQIRVRRNDTTGAGLPVSH